MSASLRFLGASNEQKHQKASDAEKIDPVTRSVIDAQFTDAFADGFYVSEVAEREAADTDLNASPRLFVAKLAQPTCEEVGLADLDHVLTIVHSGDFLQG